LIKRALLGLLICLLATPFCLGQSLKDRIAFALAVGLYEPQDKQGGGFRYSGTALGGGGVSGGEREVEIDGGVRWEAGIQIGLFDKRWKVQKDAETGKALRDEEGRKVKTLVDRKSLLAVEFEISYFKEGIGAEACFKDPDASSVQRIPLPGGVRLPLGATGDEQKLFLTLGEITIVPVAINVLWHFGFRSGKTSTYVGLGPAWVFTEWETGSSYRDFVAYDDGRIEDGPGLNTKGGLQVWLNDRWIFDFHVNYLMAAEQFRWYGTEATYGDQAFDLDGNDVPDLFGQPADYRRVDPGNLRLDGLSFMVGMRYAIPIPERKASPARKRRES